MKYWEIIRSIREDNGLSQDKLAKLLQVSQKAISNWENGIDKPSYESMLLIYDNFGISPNELMGIIERDTSLNGEQKSIIEYYESLNPLNKITLKAYLKGLFDGQQPRDKNRKTPG